MIDAIICHSETGERFESGFVVINKKTFFRKNKNEIKRIYN